MDVSSLTLHRLSLYLRCLRQLQRAKVDRISSQELAQRFDLSAAQIRKDLAHFGEFGIRGVGYEVDQLEGRLTSVLGLDLEHGLVVIGMGNLGTALACHPGFNRGSFRVVGGFDNDPGKVGTKLAHLEIQTMGSLPRVVQDTGARVGLLAVTAESAQAAYDALVEAGICAVLNFAPTPLRKADGVWTRSVDLRTHLEELVYLLSSVGEGSTTEV